MIFIFQMKKVQDSRQEYIYNIIPDTNKYQEYSYYSYYSVSSIIYM